MKKTILTSALVSVLSTPVVASELHASKHTDGHSVALSSSHAPIGVMGDHTHKKGEWMASYRYMHMHMEGLQANGKSTNAQTIATTQANRFFGTAGQPSTLRVVPLKMKMDMHMLGMMYAPADWVTLMGMANHVSKDMDHRTFQGGAGTNVLGEFNTRTSGWGDSKLAALWDVYSDETHAINIKTGLSLPTGSIDEDDDVLAPNGMTPLLRLPYAMQLGTGTYDLEPGITYAGHTGNMSWGAQYRAVFHIGENSEDYTWGDKHSLGVWGSYDWAPTLSTSVRITAETEEAIDGIDPSIVAPVQTADPRNYGGDRVTASLGANYIFHKGALRDHRLAFEVDLPVYQNLNGVQLERDWGVMIGWQKAF